MIDLIFDTDVGADCDDVMAMTYLVYAARRKMIRISAVTHCLDTPYGVPAIRAFFKFFGEPIPPVGKMVSGARLSDHYAQGLAEKFATGADFDDAEPAARVLRRALAEAENECVICAVGQFTNIAALLNSEPDDVSPLDGVALMRKKCRELVIMAANLRSEAPEWNVKWDVPAAKAMFELCPVPITVLPFETGVDMITGAELVEKYADTTPLTASFMLFNGKICAHSCDPTKTGRHSWDPATAVYAVEGVKKFLFKGERGRITLSDEGGAIFTPDTSGNVRALWPNTAGGVSEQEAKDKMAAYINECAAAVLESKI